MDNQPCGHDHQRCRSRHCRTPLVASYEDTQCLQPNAITDKGCELEGMRRCASRDIMWNASDMRVQAQQPFRRSSRLNCVALYLDPNTKNVLAKGGAHSHRQITFAVNTEVSWNEGMKSFPFLARLRHMIINNSVDSWQLINANLRLCPSLGFCFEIRTQMSMLHIYAMSATSCRVEHSK